MDGCCVLPETQFDETRLCVDTTRVLFVGSFLPLFGTAGKRPEFDVKPPLEAQILSIEFGAMI